MKKSEETNKCPVCGHEGVEEYDICPVCNWENDPVQSYNPELEGGANKMSLNKARSVYRMGEQIY